ncbi:MAG: carotenoid 1,2-hydratase [Kiloniellales bacterium]|nr:carotenoid 1,2-hydratase [Kiloniellales bacterium]
MTERARPALETAPDALAIGPSLARWENDGLIIDLDEVAVPLPRRIKGRVRLSPKNVTERCFELDPARRHRWWPIAPMARVDVALEQPGLSWTGDGYLDSNEGGEPLEAGFSRWSWSRAHLSDGSAALLYDPVFRDGREGPLALRVDRSGKIEDFEVPPRVRLPGTLWGLGRETRADPSGGAEVIKTLEDTPFYSRSMLSLDLIEPAVLAMHEGLSLDRFDKRLVQMMLPFRMPRRGG